MSTSHVILRIQDKKPDGTIRTYGVSLIGGTERERVIHLSDHILEENEYLGPRESKTGMYYFLDNDMHGLKPISLTTWPNLYITDSFGGSHNSSFNAP